MKWTCRVCYAINAEMAHTCHSCGSESYEEIEGPKSANPGFVFGNSPEIRPLPPSRSICEFCNMTASDIFKKGFEAAMEQLKKEQK